MEPTEKEILSMAKDTLQSRASYHNSTAGVFIFIFYILISAILWDWNILRWTNSGRWVFCIIIVAIIFYARKRIKQDKEVSGHIENFLNSKDEQQT